MVNVVGAAVRLGYMDVPEDVLIDISDIGRYKPEQITIITTGSQGEPMSALYRMAFSDHNQVELTSGDLVVLSSHAIPGNEVLVGKIINEMYRRGVNVYHEEEEVHRFGSRLPRGDQNDAFADQAEILHADPRRVPPPHAAQGACAVHGHGARITYSYARSGRCSELDGESCRRAGSVPSGRVLIDGYGVGDVGNIVLRDRRHLAQDGLIVVVATVDVDSCEIISGPDIISRGFVYVRESEELMDEVRAIARNVLEETLEAGVTEWNQIKSNVKDDLSKYLYSKTKRKPMILPVIMNV